jgi:hypothetical protein
MADFTAAIDVCNRGEVKTLKHILSLKKILLGSSKKCEWILEFFEGFKEITDSAKSIVLNAKNEGIINLFFVGNSVDWKKLLICVFYKGESGTKVFLNILKALEILSFKLKLGDFRTDYIPEYAKSYFKNEISIDVLYSKVLYAAKYGFKDYWNHENRFENIIFNFFGSQPYHYNSSNTSVPKFILWQYENSLRKKYKSGVMLNQDLYNDFTIEHIAPQNPDGGFGYSEDFKVNYLHKIGNLSLLTRNQNSRFGNKSFEKKRELFQETALISYMEIRDNDQWQESEIIQRSNNITCFVREYFSIN